MFKKSARWAAIAAMIVLVLALALPVLANTPSAPVSDAGIVPYILVPGGGNVECSSIGYDFTSARVNYNDGEFDAAFPEGISVVVGGGTYVAWTSTFPIGAVIVKGGNDANIYEYIPASLGDRGLASPLNASGGPAGLSNLTFCWNMALEVEKTAETTYDRDWTWTIEKSADQTDLTLAVGQTFNVNYDVVVDATSQDSNWAVTGDITVTNPNSTATAMIVSVADVISPDLAAIVDCGVQFPYELEAGDTLTCTYSADLPDDTDRVNTATVTTSGTVPGGYGTADVIFGDTPTREVDECIDVSDTLGGPLGTVCADDELPVTISYTYTVGPYEVCGDYTVDNTASFTTNDSGTVVRSSWTVNVDVPCGGGCTLTQGYWKTHSIYGPAPYDDTWAQIGEDTPFFDSGMSYYEVLWTPPAGNPYYTLAHQWIAAELNVLNGASIPADVEAAWLAAKELFDTYTPAEVAASRTLKRTFQRHVGILDHYNNGEIGPGHCSEDNSSSSSASRLSSSLLPQPILLPSVQQ